MLGVLWLFIRVVLSWFEGFNTAIDGDTYELLDMLFVEVAMKLD